MRANSDSGKIEQFILETGKSVPVNLHVYFSGGATAVMLGLRKSTIDVDIKFEPDEIAMYRGIQTMKEKLNMNIELASPHDFIPAPDNWKARSIFITRKNKVSFYQMDLFSQIIAKIQRGWKQDITDAAGFMKITGDEKQLIKIFQGMKPLFVKYPAVNVNELEKKINAFINDSLKK